MLQMSSTSFTSVFFLILPTGFDKRHASSCTCRFNSLLGPACLRLWPTESVLYAVGTLHSPVSIRGVLHTNVSLSHSLTEQDEGLKKCIDAGSF